MIDSLHKDKNLYHYSNKLSIFDHVYYDRADQDILNSPQRSYLVKRLQRFGYSFSCGSKLTSKDHPWVFTLSRPKLSQSSLFSHSIQDFKEYEIEVITPTQLACYIIQEHGNDQLEKELRLLINKQPINLKKIKDQIRLEPFKQKFLSLYPSLMDYQKQAIENSELKNKSHIGRFF